MKKNREKKRGYDELYKYMDAVEPVSEEQVKKLDGFADRISNLRRKIDSRSKIPLDMRIKDVADFMDISPVNAGRYEKRLDKGQFPSYPNLVKLATLFGVSLDYMLLGKETSDVGDNDSEDVTIQMLKNQIAERDKVIEAQETLLKHYRS